MNDHFIWCGVCTRHATTSGGVGTTSGEVVIIIQIKYEHTNRFQKFIIYNI